MPKSIIDVQFPLAGNDRGMAFQAQPPYFTPFSLNTWPRDVLEGRMRGGRRPGLKKAFSSGVTGPCHLLANVRVIEQTGAGSSQQPFVESFGAPLGAHWTQASWLTASIESWADGLGALYHGASGTPLKSGGMVLQNLQAELVTILLLDVPDR